MPESENVIEEIRESRRRLSAECGHDPARYIAMLKTFDGKYAAQVGEFRSHHHIAPCDTKRAS